MRVCGVRFRKETLAGERPRRKGRVEKWKGVPLCEKSCPLLDTSTATCKPREVCGVEG